MTFHCLVCRDRLLIQIDNQTIGIDDPVDIIVATNCGHLYHKTCLLQCFKSRRERGLANQTESTNCDICPSCNCAVKIEDLRRIYPVELPGNEDLGSNIDTSTVINTLKNEILELKAAARVQKKIIEARKSELDASVSADLESLEMSPIGVDFTTRILELERTDGGLMREHQIVWMRDDSTMTNGVVKWLGKINGIIYAGVEFEIPIGNNFSEVGGQVLFSAKSDHGRLVPVRELIMFDDI